MKSRLYCAIICYMMAFILLVVCVPIFKRLSYPKTTAVRVTEELGKGEQIQWSDTEPVTVGEIGLPEGLYQTAEEVVGRYAAVDLMEGDLLFGGKISQLPLDGDVPKDILPAGNTAKLIHIHMIEGSEYTEPEMGDVIKLNSFWKSLRDIPMLQFVRVLSVLQPEETEGITVTISVNEEQAKYIEKHQDEVFYASVMVRANEELAEKLLQEQKEYFEEG